MYKVLYRNIRIYLYTIGCTKFYTIKTIKIKYYLFILVVHNKDN